MQVPRRSRGPPSPIDGVPVRIGVIASIAHRLPPRGYGPWEQIASTLTEGFVARGHDVTLFATADSITSARLHGTARTGYEEDRELDAKVAEALHISSAFERADEFDVLANHFDFLPLSYSRLVSTPVVTTIHGFSSERIVPVFRAYDDIGHYVAISDADRHPDLTMRRRSITASTWRASPTPPPRRIPAVPREDPSGQGHGPRDRGGPPVRHAARDRRDRPGRGVLPGRDRPSCRRGHGRVRRPGGPVERDRLLGGAAALLHLIRFPEPFGLSVVESLAAGTPVIATPLGSMPELLADGRTGFLVPDTAAAADAVGRLEALDRADCRAEAVRRFSADRMVDDYLELFGRLVS